MLVVTILLFPLRERERVIVSKLFRVTVPTVSMCESYGAVCESYGPTAQVVQLSRAVLSMWPLPDTKIEQRGPDRLVEPLCAKCDEPTVAVLRVEEFVYFRCPGCGYLTVLPKPTTTLDPAA
jgi:hypothetical protein